MRLPGFWGEESGELWHNGYTVSVWDDEAILKTDSGNGCTTLLM